jgi:hypothetical protein
MSSIAFEYVSFRPKNPLPEGVERHAPVVTLLGVEDGNLSARVGFWSPGIEISPQEVTLIPETEELRAQLKHLEHIHAPIEEYDYELNHKETNVAEGIFTFHWISLHID